MGPKSINGEENVKQQLLTLHLTIPSNTIIFIFL